MKAVLISIQPEWCELIASGKKTVEVRKTKPKFVTAFTCYIYQTRKTWVYDIYSIIADWQGKVIGEFVCDEMFPIRVFENGSIQDYNFHGLGRSCVPYNDISAYIGKDRTGYGWHISDLVIYDKPKELSGFYRGCEEPECDDCPYLHFENTPNSYEGWCTCDEKIPLKRPPQSWCYVERLGDAK